MLYRTRYNVVTCTPLFISHQGTGSPPPTSEWDVEGSAVVTSSAARPTSPREADAHALCDLMRSSNTPERDMKKEGPIVIGACMPDPHMRFTPLHDVLQARHAHTATARHISTSASHPTMSRARTPSGCGEFIFMVPECVGGEDIPVLRRAARRHSAHPTSYMLWIAGSRPPVCGRAMPWTPDLLSVRAPPQGCAPWPRRRTRGR